MNYSAARNKHCQLYWSLDCDYIFVFKLSAQGRIHSLKFKRPVWSHICIKNKCRGNGDESVATAPLILGKIIV